MYMYMYIYIYIYAHNRVASSGMARLDSLRAGRPALILKVAAIVTAILIVVVHDIVYYSRRAEPEAGASSPKCMYV